MELHSVSLVALVALYLSVPYAFFMIMEALIKMKMLPALVYGGFLSGFSVVARNSGVLNISYLLYADDIVLICWVSLSQIALYSCVLKNFPG